MESNQQANSATREIRFIEDLPVDSDEFEGGSHARVAAAIIGTIKANDGGRAIGLEGAWGSGKSSVIEIVSNQLARENGPDNSKHAVFLFDCWSHQGDPIRRSFLEELVSQLKGANVIAEGDWEADIQKLRTPVNRTRTTSTPTLTWVGKLMLLIAPLLPIAYLWTSPAGIEKIENLNLSYPLENWLFVLIMIPYLAFLIESLRRYFGKVSRSESSNSIFALFSPSAQEVITDQISTLEEPTTLEFNSVFEKIIKSARAKNFRVVIVIDNLDRLPSDLIKNIWATMRNFFAAPTAGTRAETLKNVWLIVPFDRKHMKEVFEEGGTSTIDSSGFIEKTFEISFRVSPPLLSHWHGYLDKKLNAAFGDTLSANERHILFKLLEISFVSQGALVTPRGIKSFVNALVAQLKQWGDEIPLQYQALYVLQREKFTENIQKLEDSTVLDPRTASLVRGTEWAKFVAAAHYNVPPEDALEILLDLPTEKALTSHNIQRLEGLQRTTGFEHSCARLIEEKAMTWASGEPATFAEICASLDTIRFHDIATYSSAWRSLSFASESLGSWSQFSKNTAKGMAALINNAPDGHKEDCAKAVLKSLSSLKQEISTSSEGGKKWFEVIDALASALEHAVDEDAKKKVFANYRLPGTEDFVFGVAAECHNSEVVSFDTFKLPVGGEDISNSVTAEVQRPRLVDDFSPAISSFLSAPDSCNWSKVNSSIQKRLETNEPLLAPEDALTLMRVLQDIADEEAGDLESTALHNLAANLSLFGILKFAREKSHTDLQAETISALVQHYGTDSPPKGDPHPKYGNLHAEIDFYEQIKASPGQAPELVKATAKTIQRYVEFGTLLKFAIEADANRNLFRELVKHTVDEHGPKYLSLKSVLQNYDRVIEIIGEEQEEKFLTIIDEWETYASKDLEGDSLYAVSNRFYQKGAKLNTKLWQEVRGLAMKRLQGLTQEQWLEELTSEGLALGLLLDLIRNDINQNLSTPLSSALVDHSRRIMDGNVEPKKYLDEWHLLPSTLKENVRKGFYKNLLDILLSGLPAGAKIRRLSHLYEPEFMKNVKLESKANEVVRVIVCQILEEGDEEGLQYLERYATTFAECVKKADKAEKGLLEETFSKAAEREGFDKDRSAKLASSFGLKIKNPKGPPS